MDVSCLRLLGSKFNCEVKTLFSHLINENNMLSHELTLWQLDTFLSFDQATISKVSSGLLKN